MLEHEGCIEEDRARLKKQEREAAVLGQAQIKLERNGSCETKRKQKEQRRGTDRNKTNTLIAHQHLLSVQPLVSAMTHNTLNTLSEVTIPVADRNVITILLQPQGQR